MTTQTSVMDPVQQAQEARYDLPYHYVPSLKPGKFSQHVYWDWGFRYLGGLHLAMEVLHKVQFESLVDVGCGDGRFLREIRQVFPGRRLLGFDYSARAIALARAMNPDLRYECLDIFKQPPEQPFDAGTLIEVIEHIEPARLPAFIAATQQWLKPRHTLLITVPHANKPLVPKHYQHFDGAKLRALLEPYYQQLEFIPFDTRAARAPWLRLMQLLTGGRGKWFILTNRRLWHAFWRCYLGRYLYVRSEADCERIAVVCRK